jgi:hypothetical protein
MICLAVPAKTLCEVMKDPSITAKNLVRIRRSGARRLRADGGHEKIGRHSNEEFGFNLHATLRLNTRTTLREALNTRDVLCMIFDSGSGGLAVFEGTKGSHCRFEGIEEECYQDQAIFWPTR